MSNKIFVPLAMSENNEMGGEALFAIRVSPGVYRIDSVPLFAQLHHGDIVACDESDPDKLPVFQSVLESNDLVTVQLLFTPKGYRQRVDIVRAVQQSGFYMERLEGKLWAINVRPDQLDELNRLLSDYPACCRWWLDPQDEDNTF